MNFDLAQLAVPFRMQPGLARSDAAHCQLTPLAPGSARFGEKQAVWRAGASRWALPGVDEPAVLDTIAAHAPPGCSVGAGDLPLELQFEEDFALVDGERGTVPWMCVCLPSHWAPEDKLGLSLAEIHAPVADAATLQAASAALTRLVTSGEHWVRHVWTITPSDRFDQHPRRHPREPWPETDDAAAFARRCFLRVERQTFLPVKGRPQAVFAIHVMLQPLVDAVHGEPQARGLRDALVSMSDAVLAYKGLAAARTPLLRWLDRDAGDSRQANQEPTA